jgi:DNA-binding IclR family transcriptional regulator
MPSPLRTFRLTMKPFYRNPSIGGTSFRSTERQIMQTAEKDSEDRLEAVDLVIALLELLAGSAQPRQLGEIARLLAASKPRTHRHLRALIAHGYVRQDSAGGYETGARLLGLADAALHRLGFAEAARPLMTALRDDTGQAVTISALVGGQLAIVDLVNGHTLVQFAVRPGALMAPESAHGRVAAAFGTPEASLGPDLADVRRRGWATAPGKVVTGVNALAAPVFGHDGGWVGTIAIVGSVDVIAAQPAPALIARVQAAANAISERLGWRG